MDRLQGYYSRNNVGKSCKLVRDVLLIIPVNIGFHKFIDVDRSSLERSSYFVSSGFCFDCGYDHPVISAHILWWNNSGIHDIPNFFPSRYGVVNL